MGGTDMVETAAKRRGRVCPNCGSGMFEDIDTCFDCMHESVGGSNETSSSGGCAGGATVSVPVACGAAASMTAAGEATTNVPAAGGAIPSGAVPGGAASSDAALGGAASIGGGARVRNDPGEVFLRCVGPRASEPVDSGASGPGDEELWESLDEIWDYDELAAGAEDGEWPPLDMDGLADMDGLSTGGYYADEMCEDWLDPADTLALPPVGESAGTPWIVVCAPGIETSCAVPPGGMLVGRDPGCDLVVSAQAVSRRHLVIERCRGGVAARDLGATNPALLNGRALTGVHRLVMGDVLEIRGSGVTVRPVPSPSTRELVALE